MNEFMKMILSELESGIWLALILSALLVGGMVLLRRRIQWKRTAHVVMLIVYLAVVGYVTILRPGVGFGGVNLRLFRAWKEAWNSFSVNNWANVLLNILMFVPMGVLIPLTFKKCRDGRIILVALGSTLLVECIQLLTGGGVFDVDDLFANALGCLMGYCLLMTVLFAVEKKWHGSAACFLLAMIPVVAVGAIFLAYQIRPYGNLPESCIYRVDTGDMEWMVECELPEAQERAMVYKAPSMSQSECDACAASFAAYWGGEYDDILYYNEDIYYRDYDTNGHIAYLTVSRLDGSFSLWVEERSDDERVLTEADRAEVEAILAEYGITIPKEAEFFLKEEEMTHIFRADGIVTADGFLNGECSVELSEDGSYLYVDHRIVSYTPCAQEEIISPEAARQKMLDGYFYAGWFEYHDPEQVSVVSCEMAYALDTKGFYQPVYNFEVMVPGRDGSNIIMIPALASGF